MVEAETTDTTTSESKIARSELTREQELDLYFDYLLEAQLFRKNLASSEPAASIADEKHVDQIIDNLKLRRFLYDLDSPRPSDIHQAIETIGGGEYLFRQPKPGLYTLLALIYIRRLEILMWTLPIFLLVATALYLMLR